MFRIAPLYRRAHDRARRVYSLATFVAHDVPESLPTLWSKGIARVCDVRGDDGYWRRPTEALEPEERFAAAYRGAEGLVWVRLSTRTRTGADCDLDTFARRVLPGLRKPFVLVTTDGDLSVPSEVRPDTVAALLASPAMVAWYTQNHDGGTPERIRPIPIGLDLHTPRPWTSPRRLLERIGRIRRGRADITTQPLRVVSDLGLNLRSVDRLRAIAALGGVAHVDWVRTRLSQAAIWERYAASPFVLSACGNGLDAHRTWEAMALGSIVITPRTSLAPLYEGLPVVMVDDWREAADLDNLRRWRDALAPQTARETVWERLSPARWARKMRAELDAANRSGKSGRGGGAASVGFA